MSIFRVMPKGLQIKMLKDRFLKYNEHLEEAGFDLTAKMDEIDWDTYIDESCHFPENLSNLERNYLQYHWRKPEPNYIDVAEQNLIDEYPSRKPLVMTVTLHRVKRKGKTYEYGAVLVHFDPELIGRKVLINYTVIQDSEQ